MAAVSPPCSTPMAIRKSPSSSTLDFGIGFSRSFHLGVLRTPLKCRRVSKVLETSIFELNNMKKKRNMAVSAIENAAVSVINNSSVSSPATLSKSVITQVLHLRSFFSLFFFRPHGLINALWIYSVFTQLKT